MGLNLRMLSVSTSLDTIRRNTTDAEREISYCQKNRQSAMRAQPTEDERSGLRLMMSSVKDEI
jgi:hypothetical protein